jgi:hypothetical protein
VADGIFKGVVEMRFAHGAVVGFPQRFDLRALPAQAFFQKDALNCSASFTFLEEKP